jgi:hypothetical protein
LEALKGLVFGALIFGCALVALFFARFFQDTRDRLFAFFTAAFAILAFHWLVLALTDPGSEHRPLFYLLRLVAFGMIILAILEKNREIR